MGINDLSELSKLTVTGDRDIKRGDIFYIQDGYSTGSEQRAGRPAVVVSSEKGVKTSPVVSIVYLTTEPKPDMMVHVDINSANKPSIALCEQVYTVSKTRIGDYMSHVTPAEMAAIEKGIAEALGIRYGLSQEPGIQFLDTMGEDIILQANEHIRDVLRVGEQVRMYIQTLKDIMDADIRIGNKSIDDFLPAEIKQEMKQKAVDAVKASQEKYRDELNRLIGKVPAPEAEKVAPVPVFRDPNPVKPPKDAKPEMTVDEVSRLYRDEGKTITEVAMYYGVTKSAASNFITRNHLTRTSYSKSDGFRDAEVEQRRKMSKDDFKRQMIASRE